jgi:hypothetical protein
MMTRASKSIGVTALFVSLVATLTAGCTGDLIANLSEERGDDITAMFINNTAYRASFFVGSYDSLVRLPPGPIEWEQLRLEGMTSSEPIAFPCRNQLAIGTDELIQRALDTDVFDANEFDGDVFSTTVSFSAAPADSPSAALPTVGTAVGIEVQAGVDYGCGDQLIFTFEEDATAPGGFRIDYELLHTVADE